MIAASESPTGKKPANAPTMQVSPPALRVLVVEDEVIIAWELGEMLGQLGHEVCGTAVDAAEAIAQAAESRPDLVLMDVRLRRGDDGITAARAIQAQHPVPVVFCTAYGNDPTTRARMLAASAAGVLSKPILLKDLRRAIAEALPNPPG
jgi:CheY-like chemotaxis protein